MPDIGLIELALIGLVGFLVLGPERLPDFLSQVSNMLRQGRLWISSVKTQLDQEKQQLAKPIQEMKQNIESSVEREEERIKEDKSVS